MDKNKIKKAVQDILEAIGEDPQRTDLLKTPERVADMCEEIFSGIKKDARPNSKLFLSTSMMRLFCLKVFRFIQCVTIIYCLLLARAHIAYIPKGGRVTGLSKIARVVDILSKRPQVQERLTTQIAEVIMSKLKPLGVMVVLQAEHLCMSMRGVEKPGTVTITSAVRESLRIIQRRVLRRLR